MPFINEFVPEEEKSKIDWSKFKAWPHSNTYLPWKWTIDRDQDVFLVHLESTGRENERPETFALWWHGDVIRFEAEGRSSPAHVKFDLHWKIFSLSIPPHLQPERQKIFETIQTAIDSYGALYQRDTVNQVFVEFI